MKQRARNDRMFDEMLKETMFKKEFMEAIFFEEARMKKDKKNDKRSERARNMQLIFRLICSRIDEISEEILTIRTEKVEELERHRRMGTSRNVDAIKNNLAESKKTWKKIDSKMDELAMKAQEEFESKRMKEIKKVPKMPSLKKIKENLKEYNGRNGSK